MKESAKARESQRKQNTVVVSALGFPSAVHSPGNFKTKSLLRSGNPKDACVILPLRTKSDLLLIRLRFSPLANTPVMGKFLSFFPSS
jgi:hypothetical protein